MILSAKHCNVYKVVVIYHLYTLILPAQNCCYSKRETDNKTNQTIN